MCGSYSHMCMTKSQGRVTPEVSCQDPSESPRETARGYVINL